MFYAIPTFRVILTAKSLDLFSLGLKQVWTHSVLGDRIYEIKEVKESGWQGIKTERSFLLLHRNSIINEMSNQIAKCKIYVVFLLGKRTHMTDPCGTL